MAGLVAARRLAAAEEHVTVLDGGTMGGAVASRHLDGLDLDVGAEGFATRGGAVLDLLTDLGLAEHVVRPEPTGTWVYTPARASRIPDGAVLGIPTDLQDPALSQLGVGAAERARLDDELPGSVGADASTLGALVRARMGDAVAEAWAAPLIAGVHRLDIEEIGPELLLPGVMTRLAERGSLAAALAGSGGELAGLNGGIGQLVDALVGELTTAGALMLPLGAAAVERDVRGWRIRTSDGQVAHADHLLLACPPWWWPAGLPSVVAAVGREWPAPRAVDVVTLVMTTDGGGRRSGVVVADGGGRVSARALTYSSAKWGWLAEAARGRAVLRLTYDAVELDDDALQALAVTDAGTLTGAAWGAGDLRAADRTRWLMPSTAVQPGMARHRAAMRDALDGQPGLDATGGWLAGTGLAWAVADAAEAAGRVLTLRAH